MRKITFSQALVGFEMHCKTRRLSENTIIEYTRTFRKLSTWLDTDPQIASITNKQVAEFLSEQEVSKKTLYNYHTGLSSLWKWAVDEKFVSSNIIHQVPCAKPEKRTIDPLSEADIRALLAAVGRSKSYTRRGKKESDHSLPQPERSQAIIILLLDTGMRSSELCGLHISDVDFRNNRIIVFGKGDKERMVPFSPRTGQTLWKYLNTRKDDSAGDFLFVTEEDRPLDRTQLYHRLESIAERAGVQKFNPHRFRHTFAINYLRNGGDPYSLQMILGHSSMDMVRRYLAIAKADIDKFHRRASPVDHWRL